MALFGADNWLRAPLDRDVIARWTVGDGEERLHSLELPQSDARSFTFLALGDTGDSEASGPRRSPQDAVGAEMALDAGLAGESHASARASFVLHTGDVIYMTGERRLYERNFRRPYAPFLTPGSTVDNLTFRLPFLPVPGNHDYYDLGGWAKWLARIPLLGTGMRAILQELFAFSLPEGGSAMGGAYMQAFVDAHADTHSAPLPYCPGTKTRIPNRYYQFRYGNVDFFALDSNTLDGPRPGANQAQVRQDAAQRIQALEERAKTLDAQLRHHQRDLDAWRVEHRDGVAQDVDQLQRVAKVTAEMRDSLARMQQALAAACNLPMACDEAIQAIQTERRRWDEATADLNAATTTDAIRAALDALDEASDESCVTLRALEACLAVLPECPERSAIMEAHDQLQRDSQAWSDAIAPRPVELTTTLHGLSEEALDVQRELAMERRRLRYRAEDYDQAQLAWLERGLAQSVATNPDGWRVVYLHHPLYTTISNHCERPDVIGLRENILGLIRQHVHLVLAGHAHAFEWFRSEEMPNAGIFVTGGGGQVSLRPSLLSPRRLYRHRPQYASLRRAGVQEVAMGGRGPKSPDGEDGLLYHYLRVEVTPEVLRVIPVGVRRLSHDTFRREEPMPVYHAPSLPETRPSWKRRVLRAVEIRRDQPPQPLWE